MHHRHERHQQQYWCCFGAGAVLRNLLEARLLPLYKFAKRHVAHDEPAINTLKRLEQLCSGSAAPSWPLAAALAAGLVLLVPHPQMRLPQQAASPPQQQAALLRHPDPQGRHLGHLPPQ